MKALLIANSIYAGYKNRAVIHGIDLDVGSSERILLAGPNGSGKSTLLKAIMGVIPLARGGLKLNGMDIERYPTDWRIRNGLGYLIQSRNIFPSLSVHENLQLANNQKEKDFDTRKQWVLEIFPFLEKSIDKRAGLLSGGERQALAVAMVLMRKSDVLLIDEPIAGLAPKAAMGILDAINCAQNIDGFALVIVEHDLKNVAPWVSRAIFINQGRIVFEEQEPRRLLEHNHLERYFFA